jgi:hypothetical protein
LQRNVEVVGPIAAIRTLGSGRASPEDRAEVGRSKKSRSIGVAKLAVEGAKKIIHHLSNAGRLHKKSNEEEREVGCTFR